MKAVTLKPLEAETLALKALTYLAHSEDELERFVALSGVAPEDLKTRAGDPEMLAAVMDFLLADDVRIQGFCEQEAISPQVVQSARRALPGA